MKPALVPALALAALLSPALAHADAAPDPGMQLMQAMMRCPSISADGKHVAIYSVAPGADKSSRTSLAVFARGGKLERRLAIVPPATDAARATKDAAAVTKLLDDGGYKRMSRLAVVGDARTDKRTFAAKYTSEDLALDVAIAARNVTITGSRGATKLAPIKLALPAKDGPCKTSDTFDIANTMAGYDPTTKQVAFSVEVSSGDTVCFAHDFVVTLQ